MPRISYSVFKELEIKNERAIVRRVLGRELLDNHAGEHSRKFRSIEERQYKRNRAEESSVWEAPYARHERHKRVTKARALLSSRTYASRRPLCSYIWKETEIILTAMQITSGDTNSSCLAKHIGWATPRKS